MPAILHPSKQMPNSSDGTGQDIDSTSQRIGGPSFKTTTTHICKLKNKTHFYLISPGLNYPSLWQPLLTNSLCIFPERRYSQTQAFFFSIYRDIVSYIQTSLLSTLVIQTLFQLRDKVDSYSLLDELFVNELLLFAIWKERQESKIPIM